MVSRRKLFGFAAAAPVITFAATPSSADANNAPKQDLMLLTQGNDAARMYLTAKPKDEQKAEVGIAVGKDGHLWLRTNNEWKRVVTE